MDAQFLQERFQNVCSNEQTEIIFVRMNKQPFVLVPLK